MYRVFVFLALTMALSACSTLSIQQPETPQLSSVFARDTQQQWPVHWWQRFDDEGLNSLVEQALTDNYSLQAAASRIEQSQALFGQQSGETYPSLNAELGYNRSWQESRVSSAWSAGLSASYEVDLWGNISALSDQAGFNLNASQAAYRILANTVAAQVSIAWLGLRKENENLMLLHQQKQRVDTALAIIDRRQSKGLAALSDVLQQQQLLESINTQIIAAQAQYQLFKQQLALWTGQGEAELTPDDKDYLPDINASITEPPKTVSLTVLKARPDIQQAYYQLQAANAGVAAAVSNRYPRFSLSASYSGQSQNLNEIFDNWVTSLAGSLLLPIIDGGQRVQELNRQQALESEALANYHQTVLEAAQEVEEALVNDEKFKLTVKSLSEQLVLAQQAEQLSDRYYALGQIDFLAFLNAQREVLSLEQQLLDARFNAVQAQIALYKSVSHGYFEGDEP